MSRQIFIKRAEETAEAYEKRINDFFVETNDIPESQFGIHWLPSEKESVLLVRYERVEPSKQKVQGFLQK